MNELLGTFEVPVIFITAFPERFLTGQRPEPAFLIAKPFQLAVVSAVVSQALFFGRKARQRERPPSRAASVPLILAHIDVSCVRGSTGALASLRLDAGELDHLRPISRRFARDHRAATRSGV